ncbi:hypothetical protein ALC57_10701 [Trachymyrmex cornetzi]|uniref:Uncharacterized protein n=1 Tax=Trachymyrmex cornetzi TaxID=471704 RepID=A0A151J3K7_9HYME|nr:hypothetical protein ALC57_10701 [Trachymyrmex cornetzi]
MRYPFATSAIVSDSPSVKPAVNTGHLLRIVPDVENGRCARPMGERLRPPVPPSIGRSCGGTDSDRNMASASASE